MRPKSQVRSMLALGTFIVLISIAVLLFCVAPTAVSKFEAERLLKEAYGATPHAEPSSMKFRDKEGFYRCQILLEQACRKATESKDASLIYQTNFALGSLQLGAIRIQEAIDALKKAAAADPKSVIGNQVPWYLGKAYQASNEFPTARQYMVDAERVSDDYMHAYDDGVEIAFCDIHLGDHASALAIHDDEFLKLTGGLSGGVSGYASLVRARALLESGRTDEAFRTISKLKELEPGSLYGPDGSACWFSALLALRGRFSDAETFLRAGSDVERESKHTKIIIRIAKARSNGNINEELTAVQQLFSFYDSDDCSQPPLLEAITMRRRFEELCGSNPEKSKTMKEVLARMDECFLTKRASCRDAYNYLY